MAQKATKPVRKPRPWYFVQLSIPRDRFKKLSADKQIVLFALADLKGDPADRLLKLQFERNKWFHLCGEVYALLVGTIPFMLEAGTLCRLKGGAK